MTDVQPDDLGTGSELPPSTPRWVLTLGLVAALLVIGFVIFMLVGGHAPRLDH